MSVPRAGTASGLAKRLPIECEAPEVTGESLFELAVVATRLLGGKKRIAGADLEREQAVFHPTDRGDEKTWASRDERHELAERSAVDPRVTKERERARDIDTRGGRRVTRANATDQSPESRVADDGPDRLVSRNLDLGSTAEQILRERGVDPER